MFNDIIRMLRNLVKRGIQTDAPNDGGSNQIVKAKFMGQTREVKQVTPYGFYGSSPIGSELIIFSARSNPDDLYGISNIYKQRFKNLQEGEVVVFNVLSGSYSYFKEDGTIEVVSKKDLIATVEGDVIATVAGDVTATIIGDTLLTTTGKVTAIVGGAVNLTCPSLDATVVGTANVTAAIAEVIAPIITLTGNVTINGNLTIPTGTVTIAGINHNLHLHGGILTGPNTSLGPQ